MMPQDRPGRQALRALTRATGLNPSIIVRARFVFQLRRATNLAMRRSQQHIWQKPRSDIRDSQYPATQPIYLRVNPFTTVVHADTRFMCRCGWLYWRLLSALDHFHSTRLATPFTSDTVTPDGKGMACVR
ncbi:hypothetical protein RRG08_050213 [Elysia crispata]|uniref:Uncharacterized protein n=1 Tax=Elysia crispata TaxID=231223 RepID=A0AAE0Z6L9_9GAST|nr:hypothetical protein RRG08_050213 [Elysia crispata]